MTQRFVRMFVAVGLCTATLPGCAQFGGTLFGGSRPADHPEIPETSTTANRSPRQAAGEASGATAANNGPAEVPYPFTTVSDGATKVVTLAKGYKVPEFLSPPKALVQADPEALTQPVSPTATLDVDSSGPMVPSFPGQSLERPEPVVLALHCLVNQKPAEALEHLKKIDSKNEEAMMRLLGAIEVLSKKSVDKLTPEELAVLEQQVDGLRNELISHSKLVIHEIGLCQNIDGYQRREFSKSHVFHAGEQMHVFVDIRNTASKPKGDKYCTMLNGIVTIRDEAGNEQFYQDFRQAAKLNLLEGPEPRRDWPQQYTFMAPKGMPPGKYTLTMRIVDETLEPHRAVESSVQFICGP